MREYGKFGPLIGAIDEGTSNVKFLVCIPFLTLKAVVFTFVNDNTKSMQN